MKEFSEFLDVASGELALYNLTISSFRWNICLLILVRWAASDENIYTDGCSQPSWKSF
jgi:hypothetical protein